MAEVGNFKGERVVVYDSTSLAVMNGKMYVLSVFCDACKTRLIGNQNFKFCPECGAELPHIVENQNDSSDSATRQSR